MIWLLRTEAISTVKILFLFLVDPGILFLIRFVFSLTSVSQKINMLQLNQNEFIFDLKYILNHE